MIKVTLPDKTIGIAFEHPKTTVVHPSLNPKMSMMARRVIHRRTVCSIYELPENLTILGFATPFPSKGKLISTATARCHEHDQFAKEAGRKLALARALKLGGFSWAEREQIWKTYLTRPRPKSAPKAEKETIH